MVGNGCLVGVVWLLAVCCFYLVSELSAFASFCVVIRAGGFGGLFGCV